MATSQVGLDLQMSILLLTAVIGYLLSVRLGHAVVLGEIVVGILFGPSFLGLTTYSEFLQTMASFGAIVLLFTVGLETKIKEVYTLRSSLVALGGVVIPWLGGFGIAALFGYSQAEAIFIGTALTATSIAVTVAVLRELKAVDSQAAKVIIGAAVVDDILSLIMLSATAGLAKSGIIDYTQIALLAGEALGFVALSLMVGYFLADVLKRLDNLVTIKRYPENITLLAAFAIAFAYATAAELMGLSAIVGAFVAGMSLQRLELKSIKNGAHSIEAIFSAIFFVSLGALVKIDFATILSLAPFVIALTLVAAATKLAGCTAPALALGMNRREALAVGVGMIPRGEIALIIALIGLNSGAISQSTYSVLLFMTLLTTVITPLFLKSFFQKPASASTARK